MHLPDGFLNNGTAGESFAGMVAAAVVLRRARCDRLFGESAGLQGEARDISDFGVFDFQYSAATSEGERRYGVWHRSVHIFRCRW